MSLWYSSDCNKCSS